MGGGGTHALPIPRWGTFYASLFRLERLQRRYLVVVHVEDGVKPCYLQEVANVLGQVHQLEFAALIAQRGVVHHQLADARAVDVNDAGEVEQDLVVAVSRKLLYDISQFARTFTEAKLATDVHDGDIAHSSRAGLNRHLHTPRSLLHRWRPPPKCITKNANGASLPKSQVLTRRVLLSPHNVFVRAAMKFLKCLMALALIAPPAAAQKNDWLIVPGQRVGPVTAATTRADLDAMFGKENVQERNLEGNGGPEAATVVFASDTSAAMAITWDRERPAAIHICYATLTGPCRWRTASGIRIGTGIRELNKLNGKPFQAGGFAEQQGKVTSWRNGALEQDPAACGHLIVGLAPAAMVAGRDMSKNETDEWKQLQSDKPYSSSSPSVLYLNTVVSALTLEFSGTGCASR